MSVVFNSFVGPLRPSAPSSPKTFSTSFNLTENPISESGQWIRRCVWFSTCQTAGGRVYGNQPLHQNGGDYEDAYAQMADTWSANQRAEGVIDKRAGANAYQEVELHLRSSDGTNFVKCYEAFVHQNGDYITLAYWLGNTLSAPAQITYFEILADIHNITAPQDGDTFWAQIVGNILTVGINSTTYITLDITTGINPPILTGVPGIGFDNGGSGSEGFPDQYGFKSIFFTEL